MYQDWRHSGPRSRLKVYSEWNRGLIRYTHSWHMYCVLTFISEKCTYVPCMCIPLKQAWYVLDYCTILLCRFPQLVLYKFMLFMPAVASCLVWCKGGSCQHGAHWAGLIQANDEKGNQSHFGPSEKESEWSWPSRNSKRKVRITCVLCVFVYAFVYLCELCVMQ